MKNYYRILEISKNASIDEIKSSFKRKARQFHPDVHRDHKEYYHALFVEINEAYEILSDPHKRQKYDLEHNRHFFTTTSHETAVREEIFKPPNLSHSINVKSSIPFVKHIIEITDQIVRYDDQIMNIPMIDAIRCGWRSSGLFQDDYWFHITLKSLNNEILFIPFNSLFQTVNYRHEKFTEVMASLRIYVFPKILSKKINELDKLASMKISRRLAVHRTGVSINSKYFVPWDDLALEERNHAGPFFFKTDRIFINSVNQAKIKCQVRPIEHWNSILLPPVVQYYQHKVEPTGNYYWQFL